MYKVFFDQKQIFIVEGICSSITNEDEKHLFQSEEKLRSTISGFLNQQDKVRLYIICDDKERVIDSFTNLYEYRIAAGGIVRDSKGRVLLIFRKGQWDLPKGHMEKGETPEQTAVRETIEETGVKNPRLKRFIGDTWHLYYLKGSMVIKKSIWYEMFADSDCKLTPQVEEDITKTKWADPLDLPHLYKNTYLSIAELLTSYFSETEEI